MIDIRRFKDRIAEWKGGGTEEVDRRKGNNCNLVCVEDRDFFKKLRISAELDGSQVALHEMDSIADDGTWSVSLDASNLTVDSDNYIHGSASLNFDMDVAGTTTTAGFILISDMDSVDLSDYLNGQIFVYIYAPTVTGLDGFTLRIGSSASAYYSQQVTVTNENLAFHTGWMLLRFDMATLLASETGSVDDAAIDYIRLAIDKGNDSLNSTDWRVDYIVARRGIPHEVWYYSKYGWQSSAGTYLENSTANSDLLNADTEEYNIIVMKGKELLYEDLGMDKKYDKYAKKYESMRDNYKVNYPSERMMLVNDYYNFDSLESSDSNDD